MVAAVIPIAWREGARAAPDHAPVATILMAGLKKGPVMDARLGPSESDFWLDSIDAEVLRSIYFGDARHSQCLLVQRAVAAVYLLENRAVSGRGLLRTDTISARLSS